MQHTKKKGREENCEMQVIVYFKMEKNLESTYKKLQAHLEGETEVRQMKQGLCFYVLKLPTYIPKWIPQILWKEDYKSMTISCCVSG